LTPTFTLNELGLIVCINCFGTPKESSSFKSYTASSESSYYKNLEKGTPALLETQETFPNLYFDFAF